MIFIISGTSGSGKTTLVNALLADMPELTKVVTYTTRPQREGEVDGKDYHFVSGEEFLNLLTTGKFAESAWVYDYCYGTPWMNKYEGDLVLITDVQGFKTLTGNMPPEMYYSIFITSPAYEERLVGRKTEDEESLKRRLETAKEELEAAKHYDHVVVNEDFNWTLEELKSIVSGVMKCD